eukprot:1668851-Prymnesium_polylepis.1
MVLTAGPPRCKLTWRAWPLALVLARRGIRDSRIGLEGRAQRTGHSPDAPAPRTALWAMREFRKRASLTQCVRGSSSSRTPQVAASRVVAGCVVDGTEHWMDDAMVGRGRYS